MRNIYTLSKSHTVNMLVYNFFFDGGMASEPKVACSLLGKENQCFEPSEGYSISFIRRLLCINILAEYLIMPSFFFSFF